MILILLKTVNLDVVGLKNQYRYWWQAIIEDYDGLEIIITNVR